MDSSLESENGYDDNAGQGEAENDYKTFTINDNHFDAVDNSYASTNFNKDSMMNFQPIEKYDSILSDNHETSLKNENFLLDDEQPESLDDFNNLVKNDNHESIASVEKETVEIKQESFAEDNEEESEALLPNKDDPEEYNYKVNQDDGCAAQSDLVDLKQTEESASSSSEDEEDMIQEKDESSSSDDDEDQEYEKLVEEKSVSPEMRSGEMMIERTASPEQLVQLHEVCKSDNKTMTRIKHSVLGGAQPRFQDARS